MNKMPEFRRYGSAPFRVAVVHGGPGAAGEMAPVARMLSSVFGVIEPMQTADSVRGQVDELARALEAGAGCPAILVGFSWGAWLGFLTAARHPSLVRKLIVIGAGPFEEAYAASIHAVRMERLSEREREEAESLMHRMADPSRPDEIETFARLGALLGRADTFDPLDTRPDETTFRPDIFRSVWPEAAAMRKNGTLLEAARRIRCPVVAIHGNFDPHPAEGVRVPLSRVLSDFRFLLLESCGHKPWVERRAAEGFFRNLREEIA